MEVRQMLGRAGRPKYDNFGEAWVLCKGTDGWGIADDVSERYFFGPVESISSKLANEPALRAHLLASIATGGFRHRGEIGDFFSATFLGATISKMELNERLDEMLNWLVEERFIRKKGNDEAYALRRADSQVGRSEEENWDDEIPIWATIAQSTGGVELRSNRSEQNLPPKSASAFTQASLGFTSASDLAHVGGWSAPSANDHSSMEYEATLMGERITQLYLDPLSASILRTGLRRAVRRKVRENGPVTDFGLMHLASSTPDFLPLWAKNSEMERNSSLWLKTNAVEDELLADDSLEERLLGKVKSAWMLEKWIDEETLRTIESDLDVSPGDVNHRVDLMGWLLAAGRQVLLTDDAFAEEHLPIIGEIATMLDMLRQRIRHGCKTDLLQLVNIKNIGRARARELAGMGIRTPKDVMVMDRPTRNQLLAKRGWGPMLLDKIHKEVEKVLRRHESPGHQSKAITQRDDDVPLSDESPSDN
jgi:helicase